jgi:hypothetical protein
VITRQVDDCLRLIDELEKALGTVGQNLAIDLTIDTAPRIWQKQAYDRVDSLFWLVEHLRKEVQSWEQEKIAGKAAKKKSLEDVIREIVEESPAL